MDGLIYRVPKLEEYRVDARGTDGELVSRGCTEYEVYDDLLVPNGTWVALRPSFGHSWPIGVDFHDFRAVDIDERPGQCSLLSMSGAPFGFVQSEGYENLPGTPWVVPKGSLRLIYARQVHKGELGQGVPISKLRFAREHTNNARKVHSFKRTRSQLRNPHRWARLGDVREYAGVSVYCFLRDCWPFLGVSYDPTNQRCGELLHVRLGTTHEDISTQQYPHGYLTFEELSELIEGGKNLDSIWIRAGFANTILRLRALGYQPPTTATVT